MRKVALFACLTMTAVPASAEILSCDTLKARVDARLQAKGVPSYTLEIVPIAAPAPVAASGVPAAPQAVKGKEVGTCEGGTKRLMYTRGN